MDKLKQWVALTVVGALAILAAGWFLLVSPQRAEAADLQEQTETQTSANGALVQRIEVLKAQAQELPAQQAKLAAVAAKIPNDPALPTLIRALTAAADASGIELVSIAPSPPVIDAPVAVAVDPAAAPTDGTAAPTDTAAPATAAPVTAAAPAATAGTLARIPVALTVVGGYYEAERYLDALESLSRAFRVSALTLAPGESPTNPREDASTEDGRVLLTTITAEVFMATGRPADLPVTIPAQEG